MSEYVAFRLPLPDTVVTWFVTGSRTSTSKLHPGSGVQTAFARRDRPDFAHDRRVRSSSSSLTCWFMVRREIVCALARGSRVAGCRMFGRRGCRRTRGGSNRLFLPSRSRRIEPIGSAHNDAGLELLKAVARQRLAAGQEELAWAWSARSRPGPARAAVLCPSPRQSTLLRHPGSAGRGSARKIQLARSSSGSVNTMRVPTTEAIIIRTLPTSRGALT